MSNYKFRDVIQLSAGITAMLWLFMFALGEALSALPEDYEFRPLEEVRLVFDPGEFIPAGGVTKGGKLVALRVDRRGYAICSPTVYLSSEEE